MIQDLLVIQASQVQWAVRDSRDNQVIRVQSDQLDKSAFQDHRVRPEAQDLRASKVLSEVKDLWDSLVRRDSLEHLVSLVIPDLKELSDVKDPKDNQDSVEILDQLESLDLVDPLDQLDKLDLQDHLDHLVNFLLLSIFNSRANSRVFYISIIFHISNPIFIKLHFLKYVDSRPTWELIYKEF